MKLKDVIANLSAADRQSRFMSFLRPSDSGSRYGETDAVVAEHDQEPIGYLLFCDCSRLGDGSVAHQIERHS